MKAVMVMFDSLNRRFLPNYGCDWVHAPNFGRLGEHSLTFDQSFCGSMPCMPARRDLHTGRYSFLHRSWGPLEPFDNSMPQILRDAGVYTHLVSDHYHYWEDGGATYHNRYSSWEAVRGQECDRWKGQVREPDPPPNLNRESRHQWVNREYMQDEESMPQARTFAKGLEFIENNKDQYRWFLQIETFDPHEPFFVQDEYKRLYDDGYEGALFDWPEYRAVGESESEVRHIRYQYAALVSMCDRYLGRVLDAFDRLDLWRDTMLIVNTDHGYLLGEHGWWAKGVQPVYNEIAHTPLFIHDPRNPHGGERRSSLVQTIDISRTMLSFFDVTSPAEMEGGDLSNVIASNTPVHDSILFGFHAGHINWTDGSTLYMLAPDEGAPAFNYTLMPTHMTWLFTQRELETAELAQPFTFTKNMPLLKTPAGTGAPGGEAVAPRQTLLFDLEKDPQQENPITDVNRERAARAAMVDLMKHNDAPSEVYSRYGLDGEV